MRWRRNSDAAKNVLVRWGHVKPGGGWSYKVFAWCPQSSNSIGWVDCEGSITMTEDMAASTGYQLWLYAGNEGSPHPSMDFDDIFFKRTYEPAVVPKDVIQVSPAAASCWAPGSELVLTSSTTTQDNQHAVTVKSSDPSTGLITLETPVPYTTTAEDDSEFPVEVALLNRNFVLEAVSDPTNALLGGHVIFFHTPNVAQTLQGVEIVNFGQQGNLGRYPVHFHMCDAVEGSLISRNVIRDSNQRGVVVHRSHNVTVEDNVAYEIKRHAFMLEDGVEQFNNFGWNLGTGIRPVATVVPSGNAESDKSPSVFSISNTMNSFVGDVAAGSSHIGIWIEPQDGRVRGMDDSTINRQTPPLLHFANNDAHSSNFCGMSSYPNVYRPTEEAKSNLRVYRNRDCGILFHVNGNMAMEGGVAADNGSKQVWNQLADDIRLDGTRIVGNRPEFTAAMERAGRSPACETGHMQGVTFSPERQFGNSAAGMTLKDVQFSHFDCGQSTVAIEADYLRPLDGSNRWTRNIFEGVSFAEDVPRKASTCAAVGLGANPVIMEDTAGGLSGTGSPGFVFSDRLPAGTAFTTSVPA
uniref:CEMIP beta-helix domain-containing protein n=1 Tax=Pseudictyota dubia TaxID=2749911 RepID=A0A6U2C5P0_9STRA|mmetsp:Transcript_22128/g.41234  ORF Transcript_22128/g.41234 Transcript_22128/m.41234 type:complete len:579 (+) Transcript_22128:391-2127(+)